MHWFNLPFQPASEFWIAMPINNLWLSLTIPAASKAIDVAAGAAQSLGQSFSHFLADATTKVSPQPATNFEESLAVHADRLRDYLASQGITDGFRIRFEKWGNGDEASGVSGAHADAVAALLKERPHWLSELRKLASSAQAASSGPKMGSASHLNIEITDIGTSHWFLR